jgi:hypothetical protein
VESIARFKPLDSRQRQAKGRQGSLLCRSAVVVTNVVRRLFFGGCCLIQRP